MRSTLIIGLLLTLAQPAFAQSVEVKDSSDVPTDVQESPTSGKSKAEGYFKSRKVKKEAGAESGNGALPHILAVQFGTFFSRQNYNWGDGGDKPGGFNGGVTYRMGEWVNSMDVSMRLEYTSYSFDNGSAGEFTISPLLTFPDASSKFPLYFGGGLGPGLFMSQLSGKSPVALAWQLIVGIRFMDLFDNMGFLLESGVKNQVLLTSPGQFNGVFVNVGMIFDF